MTRGAIGSILDFGSGDGGSNPSGLIMLTEEEVVKFIDTDKLLEYWKDVENLEPCDEVYALLYQIQSQFALEVTRALALVRMHRREGKGYPPPLVKHPAVPFGKPVGFLDEL